MYPSLPTYGHAQAQPHGGYFDAFAWEFVPPAPPKIPRVTCTSPASVSGAIRVSGRAASYPRRADDAVIANGHTVTIDTAAVALNLTVGQGASGVLQYAMPGRPDR
jgi:hypothetical protein